jgi:23S rRNA (adenine2503-C2)-methyltransferase
MAIHVKYMNFIFASWMDILDIFGLTYEELTEQLGMLYGKGTYHSKALTREILKYGNIEFHRSDEFVKSKKLADQIKKDLVIPVPTISRMVSEGNTIKYVCRFHDGLESESVIIPMRNHNTLCVSSQIGCKMGCRFCETGSMGFKRDLTVSEIVGQVYTARFILKKAIKNIVFMGMGEPFDNFDHVQKAIEILNDQRGFDVAHSHITVSTAGLVAGIQKLGNLNWKRINLAVSLNAPNDHIRSQLMPINERFAMTDLIKALQNYPLREHGVFLIEYVLIKGLNDARIHAMELAEYLRPLNIRLNLIPLNKTSGFPVESTQDEDIHRFASYLEHEDIFIVKRWSKGAALAAGCGQLGNARLKN